MYLRRTFTMTARETRSNVIRDAGWGCIVGMQDGVPIASHLPFLVKGEPGRETLDGHMARANPQWKTFADGAEVLVVFQGPHTCVTPSLSKAERALPTWNQPAVHVYGRPVIVDAPDKVRALIKRLVDFREPRFDTPWRLESLDEGWIDRRLRAIVGFEMPIERVEATFRLMQNRSAEDRRRVADALAESDDTNNAQGAAAMMRRHSLEPAEPPPAEFVDHAPSPEPVHEQGRTQTDVPVCNRYLLESRHRCRHHLRTRRGGIFPGGVISWLSSSRINRSRDSGRAPRSSAGQARCSRKNPVMRNASRTAPMLTAPRPIRKAGSGSSLSAQAPPASRLTARPVRGET